MLMLASGSCQNLGHLSNEDGADAMIPNLEIVPRRFIWAFVKENNIKELAHMTMENQLA